MVTLEEIKKYLKLYDGPDIRLMEVCGSHTAAIAKNGIPGLLSDKIHLISGPGCPVCVTPSAYVDKAVELSMRDGTVLVTFGDLIRVPGSEGQTLQGARGMGARVRMVYSPLETIDLAKENPDMEFVFAAVGFETTTPLYALLVDRLVRENISNVRLLTAVKTMPEVIRYLMKNGADIDGFIAPGHVSVVTGSAVFEPLAREFQVPFGVAGFSGRELLAALYGIVRHIGEGEVMNYYPSVVTRDGNTRAKALIDQYFVKSGAVWRGMGLVPASGRILRGEYRKFDAGSSGLWQDRKANPACQCDQILMGKKKPVDCPLYGKVCTPIHPQGACMVSAEGSCHTWLAGHRTN